MMWLLYALLSAATAALVALFSKLGSAHIDSTLATTLRSVVMTIILLVISISFKKLELSHLYTIPTKDLIYIILSGLAGACSWIFYFYAIKIGAVHNVVAIDRLSLVMAAVLSVLVLGEVISMKAWLGISCMTLGALLMIGG